MPRPRPLSLSPDIPLGAVSAPYVRAFLFFCYDTELQAPMSDDYGDLVETTGHPDLEKDPDATIDIPFNWALDLDGDTISTSQFLLPDGLTSVSTSNTTTTATIFVSGGAEGRVYRVTNRVTTAGGRTWDKTKRVLVKAL